LKKPPVVLWLDDRRIVRRQTKATGCKAWIAPKMFSANVIVSVSGTIRRTGSTVRRAGISVGAG